LLEGDFHDLSICDLKLAHKNSCDPMARIGWMSLCGIIYVAMFSNASALAVGSIQHIVRTVFVRLVYQHVILYLRYRLGLSSWRHFGPANGAIFGDRDEGVEAVGAWHIS